MILLYKCYNTKTNKTYVGVTNNFSRRLVEHQRDDFSSFGDDIAKYGIEVFDVKFEMFSNYDEAFKREAQILTDEVCNSDEYYNTRLGGRKGKLCSNKQPKRDGRQNNHHPCHFSSEYNPMYDEEVKKKMISKQKCKKVLIDGVEYYSVREASRQLDTNRKTIVNRLKNPNFPSYIYID